MENEAYLKEVLARLDGEIEKIKNAKTPTEISSRERMVFPILTKLQMVVPRIGDDIIKLTRKRRSELLKGK